MSNGRERLLKLRRETIEAGDRMDEMRGRFNAIEGGPKTAAVVAFNLFQTPEAIAADMVSKAIEAAGIGLDGLRVLEPSAGLGRIYRAIRERSKACEVVLVENAPQCAGQLYQETAGDEAARLVQDDFLTCDAVRLGGLFDVVVMNPPFKMGLDLKHIEHARGLLKAGGVLVSLCYAGERQRAKFGEVWEMLPSESFRSEGTRADVARVVVRK
jgi:predicted RNA methylase